MSGERRRGALALVAGLGALALLAFAGCARHAGRFELVTLESARLGGRHDYALYLPKGWDRNTPLPLVVLLHGAGDDARSADRSDVVAALDEAIAAGNLPPFVMVAPDGDRGFWVNWHDGSHRYRDWVLDEVVPAVRARLPLAPAPAGLHLLGVSMGAGGGMQMWLSEPATFASAALLSAPILNERDTRVFLRRFVPEQGLTRVFGPEGEGSGRDPYALLQRASDLRGSRLIFGAATRDRGSILASNQKFAALLAARGVPHTFVTFPGRHGWRAWARVFPYVLCKQLDPACALVPPR